jgi:DNA invertase Pin-like site-specific DNA recombinase
MKTLRCAIYTRKSSEEGLEQSFNSLHAQREACEAYIRSQRHEGWHVLKTTYDDGGFSGGNLNRPGLTRLLQDISDKKIDAVVVYKVDRLTRSLMDFAKIVEQFDKQGVSFVSVTQQFNTTSSMGRLTLNVLLSFAQFEREVTGERIRDKIAASKRKGMWMGGVVPTGYELKERELVVNPEAADQVRQIFGLYLELGCVSRLKEHLQKTGIHSQRRVSKKGLVSGGAVYSRGALYKMLNNRIYLGEITHKGAVYLGRHEPIIGRALWNQIHQHMEDNLQAERTRPRATASSLLTGILFDQDGNRFTPSHAAKGGRRYRYYVSQSERSKTLRFPASDIEHVVVSEIQQLLESPLRLLDALRKGPEDAVDLEAVISDLERRALIKADEPESIVRRIVTRVVIQADQIQIHVNRKTLWSFIADEYISETQEYDDNLVLAVKAQFLKRRGQVRLVLPPDSPLAKPLEVPSLIRAMAKAHNWVDQIQKGTALNQRAIAASTGLDKRYVSRILPLAFLAPDITEAILDGRQPGALSLSDCINLPLNWFEQHQALKTIPQSGTKQSHAIS